MTQSYTGSSNVDDGKNVGFGAGVYKQRNLTREIELRTLTAASTDLTVAENGDEIDIDVVSATAATADTIVKRDASGRIAAADGVAAGDVATVGQLPSLPSAAVKTFSGSEVSGTNTTYYTLINQTAGTGKCFTALQGMAHSQANTAVAVTGIRVTFTYSDASTIVLEDNRSMSARATASFNSRVMVIVSDQSSYSTGFAFSTDDKTGLYLTGIKVEVKSDQPPGGVGKQASVECMEVDQT